MTAEKKRNSPFAEMWRRLKKNKPAMASLLVILLLAMLVVGADWIVSYDKAVTQHVELKLASPGPGHPFGGDGLGRDLFARVIHGTRISLLLGFGATAITTIVGTILGASTAYFGGWYDSIIMRILDIIISIPIILLALAIASGFGIGIVQLVISIAIGQIASFTRVIRASVLNVASQEYIEAAKAIGIGDFTIILRHVIPNVLGTIQVQFTMQVAENILMGATLGFLGLGAKIPAPEWGKILSEGLPYLRFTSHIVVFPTLFIAVTALSINLFGDGLRDAFDPKLKGKA